MRIIINLLFYLGFKRQTYPFTSHRQDQECTQTHCKKKFLFLKRVVEVKEPFMNRTLMYDIKICKLIKIWLQGERVLM